MLFLLIPEKTALPRGDFVGNHNADVREGNDDDQRHQRRSQNELGILEPGFIPKEFLDRFHCSLSSICQRTIRWIRFRLSVREQPRGARGTRGNEHGKSFPPSFHPVIPVPPWFAFPYTQRNVIPPLPSGGRRGRQVGCDFVVFVSVLGTCFTRGVGSRR